MAKLYVKYSAMGGAKSALLQLIAYNYEEQGLKVKVIKPSTDTRVKGFIYSRIGLKRMADYDVTPSDSLIPSLAEAVKEDVKAVTVDEAQFLTASQVEELYIFTKKYDIAVTCYCLRTDFTSHFFEGSRRLFELADSIEELSTVICECGQYARFNARMNSAGEYESVGDQVVIDNGETHTYKALCGECYFRKVLKKL